MSRSSTVAEWTVESAVEAVSRPRPNFFLVGAARAGTTALWNRLRQHPDVFMPLRSKEPYFFSDVQPDWAIQSMDDYLGLFAGAGEASAIGEASTGYFVAPEVPTRIRDFAPDARIIIMLRDPLERANSLYRLNCSFGIERLQTFEEALRQEESRLRDAALKQANEYYYASLLYVRSALMADPLRRYQAAFPAGQIHVLLFDDFKKNPQQETEKVFRFLGVDPQARVDDTTARPEVLPEDRARNAADLPLWVAAQYQMCRWWKTRVDRRCASDPQLAAAYQMDFIDRCCHRLTEANRRLGARFRPQELTRETRRALRERFADDIRATSALIGRDLTMWLE